MRRSIATASLSGGLPEKLHAAASAKFDLVEIVEADLIAFDGTPEAARALAEDLGLGIAGYQPFANFESRSEEAFRKGLDRAERKFELMSALGASTLLVTASTSPLAPDRAQAVAQLRELAARAEARGLKVGYQALPWAQNVRTWSDAWEIVRDAGHPALGLVLNSFHTLAGGGAFDRIAEVPGDRIFGLQLSDAPRLPVDLAAVARHFRCFPGQGALDVVGFLRAVLSTGYDGPVSIEVTSDAFLSAPPAQLAADAMRSLTYLQETLDAPAAYAGLEGVGFIEFAVDAASGQELARWLEGMGFAPAGAHRTKAVSLYSQGDLRVVLNASTDSFAHSYFLLHGPSVCAIALKTEAREALLARADAYDYRRYQERHGPNEYDMPAVRAPDGSLFNLVDRAYDPAQDFELAAAREAGPAILTGVDHIARAVPPAQFESWLLYEHVLLGLRADDPMDLPEPHGLVRSRALASPDGAVRLPLASSEGGRTAVARSLDTFSGAGVNQIAFATDDIFAAVERMRAAGARLLPIPDNYYADLAARTDLSETMVERLRAHGVLYDRDGRGGVFLHAYSETFEDRFFFEIVQRSGGYAAYGAANAPLRMAVQAGLESPAGEGAWL